MINNKYILQYIPLTNILTKLQIRKKLYMGNPWYIFTYIYTLFFNKNNNNNNKLKSIYHSIYPIYCVLFIHFSIYEEYIP